MIPFWLVKCSVSPLWCVPREIVTVALVRSVLLELTVTPGSTATGELLSIRYVLVVPDGIITGAAAATTTCSAAEPLCCAASTTLIEIARVMRFGLVVENVTDCKAAAYWAGVAVPLKVSTPSE